MHRSVRPKITMVLWIGAEIYFFRPEHIKSTAMNVAYRPALKKSLDLFPELFPFFSEQINPIVDALLVK